MKLHTVALWLAALGGAFIAYIGLSYLIVPGSIVTGFGFPRWPGGDADGFYAVKGTRDLVCGLVVFALIAAREHRALAIALGVVSLIPFGDAINVLSHHGSIATALGVHTATALFVLFTAALLYRTSERDSDTARQLDQSSSVAAL
ncbi:DUF4267 domain-containing protein [Antrihabitans cavernicola]|nr:DUF4267 domain-containing protein [Spelaeibacter cavernicola]